MTQLTQLIVQGISTGAIYGLVALGLDTPALRLNRQVVASRYANLFTELIGV